jgi:putative ABC transport system permease protein
MNELRFAFRQLVKRPGFTVVAVVTLALGIGANAAIYSVIHGVLLRPLAYPDADRLVSVWLTYPHWQEREILRQYWDRIELSYPEYRRLRDDASSFDALSIYRTDEATVAGGGQPEVVLAGSVDHALPAVLGVPPLAGRWFEQSEVGPAAPALAVLEHGFWRRRFGGDPAAIGSTLRLDGQPFTVIGVMPPPFRPTRPGETATPDLWVPVGRITEELDEGNHMFAAVGRLRAGVSVARAADEAVGILRGGRPASTRGARIVPLKEQMVAESRPALHLVWAAVGLILLVACVSVSNLLLGRASEREQEIALRTALGAGRGRIVRQLLVESLLLALLGGAAGIALAWWGTTALLGIAPPELPRLDTVRLDLPVLGFTLAVTLVTGLVFGAAPALVASGRGPAGPMRARAAQGRGFHRLQGALVAGQLALALVLLVGAGLLTRTLLALSRVDPGFRRDGLVTFRVEAPEGRYSDGAAVREFYRELGARLAALPGVSAVSTTSLLPLSGEAANNSVWLASSGPERRDVPKPEAERRIVTPEYFGALGIPLLRGRSFTSADGPTAAPVMVVSRAAAERLWDERDPLGDRVEMNDTWWSVVGVVGDVRDRAISAEPVATVYVPSAQWPTRARTVVLSTTLPTAVLSPALRSTVGQLDVELPIRDLRSMREVTATAVAAERFRARLVGGFAVLALALGATGLFGVTGHAVARRTREIGIRVALGARRLQVLGLVLKRVAGTVGIGLAVGTALAVPASRLLERFLFGVRPLDAVTFLATAALLATVALAAALGPARRAARIDPMEALRHE